MKRTTTESLIVLVFLFSYRCPLINLANENTKIVWECENFVSSKHENDEPGRVNVKSASGSDLFFCVGVSFDKDIRYYDLLDRLTTLFHLLGYLVWFTGFWKIYRFCRDFVDLERILGIFDFKYKYSCM